MIYDIKREEEESASRRGIAWKGVSHERGI
jgi:hypothetical protein